MTEPLIRLRRTFEEAMSFRDSPQNRFYIHNGVQLLPNNEMKYVQVTDVKDGINLEDWVVNVVDLEKGTETNISEYFNVEALTNDFDGNPQFYWSLDNVPFDFGWKCVYLKVEQVFGEIFYSNPFLFTDYQKQYTTQFHYKDYEDDVMQSIGLTTYFRQPLVEQEIQKYFKTSTQKYAISSLKNVDLEVHFTKVMSFENLIGLISILGNQYVYMDGVRSVLNEALQLPKAKGDENFGQIEFVVCPDKNDIYEEPQPSRGDFLSSDWNSSDWNIYN